MTPEGFVAKTRLTAAGCWEWGGRRTSKGYGALKVERRETRAHRLAFEMFVGPIPDGLEIDHLCRNRACVNPDHLEAVDHHTNLLRGDTLAHRHAIAVSCPFGHPYDEENTVIVRRADPSRPVERRCRACKRRRDREQYRKRQGMPA